MSNRCKADGAHSAASQHWLLPPLCGSRWQDVNNPPRVADSGRSESERGADRDTSPDWDL